MRHDSILDKNKNKESASRGGELDLVLGRWKGVFAVVGRWRGYALCFGEGDVWAIVPAEATSHMSRPIGVAKASASIIHPSNYDSRAREGKSFTSLFPPLTPSVVYWSNRAPG